MKNRVLLVIIAGIIVLLLAAIIAVKYVDSSKRSIMVESQELLSEQKKEEDLARRIANEERIRKKEKEQIEEYLAEERRKREEEKRLEEERKRQGVERIIKIDYSLILNRAGYKDYAGSLQGLSLYRDGVYTKTVIIPNGKVWQLKNISYSGYSGSNPPKFYYCKNENGAFDVGLKELENGQILYPWGYTFWIMFDEKRNESGRRTAEIVFLEKEY